LLLLCALCSCFVHRASCSCFVLIRFFGHRLPSTKHKARSIRTVTLPRRSRSHENRVFLSHTTKQKVQTMSTKQPIWTKRCDFEHKGRSMSTKQQQKNWAQLAFVMLLSLPSLEGAARQGGDNCVAWIILSRGCFFMPSLSRCARSHFGQVEAPPGCAFQPFMISRDIDRISTNRSADLSPVFLSLLCALCSCFVLMLCALCSVLMLCAYRRFWSPLAKHKAQSTKHEACARSMRTAQMASSSRRALLLTKIGSFCVAHGQA
jgi:hypothetical protein